MDFDQDLDLTKVLLASQEKFVYFFLIAAGAAITFVIQKYESNPDPWKNVLPLLAMGAWGASFIAGSIGLLHMHAALRANLDWIKLRRLADGNKFKFEHEMGREKDRYEFEDNYASNCFRAQFWTMAAGAGLYLSTITSAAARALFNC